jgi:anti-sigma regulatory factor (Ser/Thr protein kinase)
MAVERSSLASLELRLQARPEFVPVLRGRVRTWLEDAGASKTDTFEVLLATTEAFTNAVEHPHQPTSQLVDVEGSITDHTITLSIRDYGTWQDERTRKEQGGIGLVLMEALMDTVRVECFLDGTTVTMRRRLAMH